jgi:sugar lactone lactonase YvrE
VKPELLLDARAALGEGPCWDERSRRLYWVDIRIGRLHSFDPQTGEDSFLSLGETLGCAAPRQAGGLILALRSGFALLDPQSGARTPLQAPEAAHPGNRFNDGKCDPAGRFLAGSMDDAEKETRGSLYSLDAHGRLQVLLHPVGISNGLAWSPDQRTFYYIDTPTRLVMAYDYDPDSGAIANPRPALRVPAELGWPDGMTADRQGMLWVALWGGASLTRWDPATGSLLETVRFPALNVTSCAFGGPDLTDLYVTSARKGMSAAQLEEYPLSGGLFRLRTGMEGQPAYAYDG